jgi:hypothetical protein
MILYGFSQMLSSAKAKNFCLNFIPPAKAGGNSEIPYLYKYLQGLKTLQETF